MGAHGLKKSSALGGSMPLLINTRNGRKNAHSNSFYHHPKGGRRVYFSKTLNLPRHPSTLIHDSDVKFVFILITLAGKKFPNVERVPPKKAFKNLICDN
jgi:hypothetical protein